jgi:tRNA pseudouridine38-40 synthase
MFENVSLSRRRIALLLEYDGTRFAGSQYQPGLPTVQGALEEAVLRTTGEPVRAAFAGRTDAGVHARGQVASFDTAGALAPEVIQRALNAWLPRDVAVLEAVEAAPDLDVRRDARRRHYRYVIDNRPVRPALDRERAWHVPGDLDVAAMDRAACQLVGRHDFAAFASALESPDAGTVRELYAFTVRRAGTQICCDLVANAFLPHQVRRMVGALTIVGQGRMAEAAYAALLDAPPSTAGPAAPAHGLYLMSVEYDAPLFATRLDSEVVVC